MLARKLFFILCLLITNKNFALAEQKVRVLLGTLKEDALLSVVKSKINGIPADGDIKLTKSLVAWNFTVQEKNYQCPFEGTFLIYGDISFQKYSHLKFIAAHCFEDRLDVVAHVSFNDYLLGVIASEMPTSWNNEALKAQAVTSRTYTLWRMQSNRQKNYDVVPTVLDQVYNTELTIGNRLQSKLKSILKETADEILIDKQGRVSQAYFHADCGGHTTTPEQAWGQKNNYQPVSYDLSCAHRKSNNWSTRMPTRDFETLVKSKFILPEDWKLFKIISRKENNYNRVDAVDLIFMNGQVKRVPGDQMRAVVGYSSLKSTNFEINFNKKHVSFSGKGNGHGVGLCQWGSRSLAENGLDYHKILKHYFPSSYITNRQNIL